MHPQNEHTTNGMADEKRSIENVKITSEFGLCLCGETREEREMRFAEPRGHDVLCECSINRVRDGRLTVQVSNVTTITEQNTGTNESYRTSHRTHPSPARGRRYEIPRAPVSLFQLSGLSIVGSETNLSRKRQ